MTVNLTSASSLQLGWWFFENPLIKRTLRFSLEPKQVLLRTMFWIVQELLPWLSFEALKLVLQWHRSKETVLAPLFCRMYQRDWGRLTTAPILSSTNWRSGRTHSMAELHRPSDTLHLLHGLILPCFRGINSVSQANIPHVYFAENIPNPGERYQK